MGRKLFVMATAVLAFAMFAFAQDQYCFWAADNCWIMNGTGDTPDAASCISKSGTPVTDCANPGFTVSYCNYGTCAGGSGDDCTSGGCFPTTTGTCDGGVTAISECPCASLSPNALTAAGARCDNFVTPPTPKNCFWSATSCWPLGGTGDAATEATCIGSGGKVIDDCSNPPAQQFCDYGDCVNGNGYNCGPDSGCYPFDESSDDPTCAHGTTVSQCPCASLSPSAKIDAGARCGSGNSIISLCSKSTASAALSASYTKGGISVNWNAGSQVRSGTISLINAKGVTVASSSIRANASNISAKLGSKSALPTGMYFVRIDARDVSGKRIVQQVPVQIVK